MIWDLWGDSFFGESCSVRVRKGKEVCCFIKKYVKCDFWFLFLGDGWGMGLKVIGVFVVVVVIINVVVSILYWFWWGLVIFFGEVDVIVCERDIYIVRCFGIVYFFFWEE